PCEVCKGKRYNRETLEVKYKGKSIADVLDMTVEEALAFFAPLPKIARKLQTLYDVGLGYVKLGQPSTTLSGGEAQRVKLATELSRRDTGRTLYVLDEPTTGLHVADVDRLLKILQRLCEGGSSVLVIEHNLDVIKTADYVIDLGPEGGARGGQIVACGTPEEVAAVEGSYTGQYLKKML
ncbi:MAG: excinuclease ABC subunit UvrA, partial [Clostridia bacterium]|nr:excinuclease ABC subunit UvrA [Clostridia bacterium]